MEEAQKARWFGFSEGFQEVSGFRVWGFRRFQGVGLRVSAFKFQV